MVTVNARTICIFEDAAYTRLLPPAYTRPVYDLVCGLSTLREKILRQYRGCECILHCRSYLAATLRIENPGIRINETPGGDCLFINGRILVAADFAGHIPMEGKETLYVSGKTLIAARVGRERAQRLDLASPLDLETFAIGERIECDADMIRYPWDCIERNGEYIRQDFEQKIGTGSLGEGIHESVTVLEEHRVFVERGARIKPNVVLDAEGGPIYVGQRATISSNATIEGPAVIGPETQVNAGARISGGTTIGPICKIGGEVSQSIIHGYSNKQHDGYLGHSYIGSWVNLGAGTTNSDLKNNYQPVRVCVNGEFVNTESLFVGLIMGDHSKAGIQTMFTTGTVVGVSCNVFGADFPPKYIPSYSWGGSGGVTEYELEKAIETARTVMARRNRELTPEGEDLLRYIFGITAAERGSVA